MKNQDVNGPADGLQCIGRPSLLQCSQSVEHRSRVPLYDLTNGVYVASYTLTLIPGMTDGRTSAMRRIEPYRLMATG